jgi:hypothetical protein
MILFGRSDIVLTLTNQLRPGSDSRDAQVDMHGHVVIDVAVIASRVLNTASGDTPGKAWKIYIGNRQNNCFMC